MKSAYEIRSIIDKAYLGGRLTYEDLKLLCDHINGCAKEMRRRDGAAVASQISKGSQVRISFDCDLRPRYILGTQATVLKVNTTTATIELGHVASPNGRSRFYTGQEIRCPLNALEPVAAG